MSDKSNDGVNRRRVMKFLGAAGLGTGSMKSVAARGERSNPSQGTEAADPVDYSDLSPAAQRHVDAALEEGRHTIRAADAPESLNGVHHVRYRGETYDLFSHSRYVPVYHLNPEEVSGVTASKEQDVISFEELSKASGDAFKIAVEEGGFEGDGSLPDEFSANDFVSYGGSVYKIRSVQGTAKESVMIPRVV